MVVTPGIANMIREGKTHMIYGAIETGSKMGMVPPGGASLRIRSGMWDRYFERRRALATGTTARCTCCKRHWSKIRFIRISRIY
jgi:hypothetical protein